MRPVNRQSAAIGIELFDATERRLGTTVGVKRNRLDLPVGCGGHTFRRDALINHRAAVADDARDRFRVTESTVGVVWRQTTPMQMVLMEMPPGHKGVAIPAQPEAKAEPNRLAIPGEADSRCVTGCGWKWRPAAIIVRIAP